MTSSLSYCASLVRTHDNDRFLCSIFQPPDIREAWLTLFAFNHEIAVIKESVSEEMLGFIRFAWWREALDEIYAGQNPRKHPVVEALARIIRVHDLPRIKFNELIEAREKRLQEESFENFADLTSYCHATSTALLELCAACLPEKNASSLDTIGLHWAYVGLLRSLPEYILPFDQELTTSALTIGGQIEKQHIDKSVFYPFYLCSRFYLRRLLRNRTTHSPFTKLRLMLLLGTKNYRFGKS